MSLSALVSALAAHLACIAATLIFVVPVPLPTPPAVAMAVTIEPEPAALNRPPEVPDPAKAQPDPAIRTASEQPVPQAATSAESDAALSEMVAEAQLQPAVPISAQPGAAITTSSEEPPAPAVDARQPDVALADEPAEIQVQSAAKILPLPAPLPSSASAHFQSHPVVTHHAPALPRRTDTRSSDRVEASQSANAMIAASSDAAPGANREPGFEARIRDAVQAAVHYPAAARMMGVTGRARIDLDYRNGAVGGPSIVQSSGVPMLDQAAISAAKVAHYPPTPEYLAGRVMHFLVWVEFRSG